MDEDKIKETVLEHKAIIPQLVASVEHLVETQTETNKRLEEISKYLAKQAVFSSKLADMDRNLTESFKRVWERLEVVEYAQKDEKGCNSVKLLNKDVQATNKELDAVVTGMTNMETVINTYPSSSTLKWLLGTILFWTVTFGVYITDSINKLNATDAKVSALLDRDISDIQTLRGALYGTPIKTHR